MDTFLAIDPGMTGGLALFSSGVLQHVHGAGASTGLLRILIRMNELDGVVLEQVNGIPNQSAPAAFTFGRIYGEIRGVCDAEGLPVIDVPPSVWKGALGLRRGHVETVYALKKRSRELATDIFPDFAASFARGKDDGRAEASLIGHWYLTKGPRND